MIRKDASYNFNIVAIRIVLHIVSCNITQTTKQDEMSAVKFPAHPATHPISLHIP